MEGQRWKASYQQKLKEGARRRINLQENVQLYAASLVQRINDAPIKNIKQMNEKINSEIQSNICSICLQLMLPPLRNPILLFPCGHNICKECLFQHPPQGQLKKNLKLKLQKCALCRQKIDSYALNHSLMTLICTYSNNKHLLQLEQQGAEEKTQENTSQHLNARCAILQEELQSLTAEYQQYSRSRAILTQVIETLKREKKKVEREMEKTEEEGRLIDRCLSEKVQEMEFVEKSLQEAQQRSNVLERAIQPLQQQKERKELMLISRIIERN